MIALLGVIGDIKRFKTSPPARAPCAGSIRSWGGQLTVPVYVYRRQDGSIFEIEQRMTEDTLVSCPRTGQSVERVLQPFTPR